MRILRESPALANILNEEEEEERAFKRKMFRKEQESIFNKNYKPNDHSKNNSSKKEKTKEPEITKEQIEKIIPLSKTNLFYKFKLILSSNTLDKLKEELKKNKLIKTKTEKNVFIIRVKYDPDEEAILNISCSKYKLTPDLNLEPDIGAFKTIIYSRADLIKYGFTNEIIKKIIDVTDNRLLSKKITSNISDVLENKNPEMKTHDDRVNVRLELMKVFPKGPKLDKAFRDYMTDKIDIKGNYLSEDIKEAEATKEQIEKILPLSNYNLYDNDKLILSNSSLDDIKKKVKKDKLLKIEKTKKVYFIKATYDPKNESKVLSIMCRIYNITPDLEFEYIQKNSDIVIYSKDELKKYGFTNDIIKKIYHFVDNDINNKTFTSNISDVLENKINQSKKESIEKAIEEMPPKKMTAKEAKEEKERESLAERAELKQIIYTLYMDGKISSELSGKLRTAIDAGKLTKEQMAKEIMKEQKGEPEEEPKRGRPSKKESSKKEKSLSPIRPKSPEPVKKKGRPKKVASPEPSPERSLSPEPVKKKKTIKEAMSTPSKIVSTSKTLKDALQEPVRQLDLLNATIKAKLDSGDHIMIDTYLKIRKDLTAKEKKAIRASLERELEDKMKGTGLNHPMHQIYGYGINRTEEAHEYFQHVKNRFGKI